MLNDNDSDITEDARAFLDGITSAEEQTEFSREEWIQLLLEAARILRTDASVPLGHDCAAERRKKLRLVK